MKHLLLLPLLGLLFGCADYAHNLQLATDEELFQELATVAVLLPEGRHATVRDELRRRHPDWNWAVIDQGRIFEGMTKQEVILAWGPPHRINQSSYGEQWVYHRGAKDKPTDYLHFENDVLADTK
jgi:hypothetical protein